MLRTRTAKSRCTFTIVPVALYLQEPIKRQFVDHVSLIRVARGFQGDRRQAEEWQLLLLHALHLVAILMQDQVTHLSFVVRKKLDFSINRL